MLSTISAVKPPRVMGVLNVTPDSFSDGGRYLDPAAAVARAEEMLAEGADIIDVGGESSRPGARSVTIDEERARVVPVIEALAGRCTLSIDTRNAEVARAAVEAGASIINDISASLGPVAAETGVGWIAMHMAGEPATMQENPRYDDVVEEVLGYLTRRAEEAYDAGVREIWIDPGIGFGKTVEHNLQLLAALDRFVASGWPVALGTSRKSTMGVLTARSDQRVGLGEGGSTSVTDRLEASVASAVWAMHRGVSLIRAHDVRSHRHAALVVAGAMPQVAPPS